MKLLWALVGLAFLGLLAAAGASVQSKWAAASATPAPTPEPLEEEAPPVVGDWELVERSGQPYGSKDLKGRVWIANFVFTNCAGPCPVMTQAMEDVVGRLKDEPELRFVTFSVDPKRDDPETLRKFAAKYKEDPRWLFVTGWPVYNLVYDRFRMMARPAENPTPGNEIIHSTSFVLVDATGTVRMLSKYEIDFDDAGEPIVKQGNPLDLVRRAKELLRSGGVPAPTPAPAPAPADPLAGKPGWVRSLPDLNAALNGTCAILLLAGLLFIKTGKPRAHKAAMLAALAVSALFLASYLTYHGLVGSVKFQKPGWIRPVYFAVLLSHTILAAFILPMALGSAWLGWKERLETHKRLARVTLPLWLYVSLTGILVYVLLYQS